MNNIYGCVFGGAYGDALGKATEFLSPEDVTKYYPRDIHFSDIIDDFHRNGWEKTDWTDDTDQSILVMRTLKDSTVQDCHTSFARKLYHWVFNGFPELGDTSGIGIGIQVGWVIKSKDFVSDPFNASEEVWRNTDGTLYEDGGIMRTAIIGCFNKPKIELFEYTKKICQTTHYDPRCIASCIFIVSCVYDFVHEEKDVEKVLSDAEETCIEFIQNLRYIQGMQYSKEEYVNKMRRYIHKGKSIKTLSEIDFNKGHSRSKTKYPLYCAIYGIMSVYKDPDAFERVIQEIMRRGGDSDTNACVAGNMMGAFIGFHKLPKSVYSMKNFFWLKNEIDVNLEMNTQRV